MKTTLLKTTLTLTLATALFTGCGSSGSLSGAVNNVEDTLTNEVGQGSNSTGDAGKIQKVAYSFNNDKVNCLGIANPADIVAFQTLTTCTWHCGEYEGAKPVTVLLTFRRTNNDIHGAWQLETDLVLNAPGYCHD